LLYTHSIPTSSPDRTLTLRAPLGSTRSSPGTDASRMELKLSVMPIGEQKRNTRPAKLRALLAQSRCKPLAADRQTRDSRSESKATMVRYVVGLDSNFGGACLSLMVIFTFASSNRPDLFVLRRISRSGMPDNYGPWICTGRSNPDAAARTLSGDSRGGARRSWITNMGRRKGS
jgi:hypothetical protein